MSNESYESMWPISPCFLIIIIFLWRSIIWMIIIIVILPNIIFVMFNYPNNYTSQVSALDDVQSKYSVHMLGIIIFMFINVYKK